VLKEGRWMIDIKCSVFILERLSILLGFVIISVKRRQMDD